MASGDCRKDDFTEENRVDSGIESYRSMLKSEEQRTELSGPRDKFPHAEERLDSAYGSASLTVESLSDIVEGCTLEREAANSGLPEPEENLITSITEDGDTILHLAIIHEEELIAQQLIQIFPSEVLDIQNNLYQSPLHLATYLNLAEVVKSLVAKKVSLELQDQDGNTALHVACHHGLTMCATEMTSEISPSKLALVLETQNWRGRNQRQNASPPRRRAARRCVGEAAAEQGGQRGRRHVQRMHAAAPGRGQAGRHHRQPPLPVRRRHHAAEHGGRDGVGPG
ncbi:NF-kappa-B inhibitor epsilon isoform X2 [Dunckerocampus dactyliophorus]|uniref:NF-kappa-B inhibitor epsilon isoform X2 n=1 Tax=Dunckerocampus dactyliophorus TaxID=161453 RepID=UPI002406320F|nr:NF-kappa-B inhibitor epsilon isoform X2 [Dunckerocampus dactyliophorus]